MLVLSNGLDSILKHIKYRGRKEVENGAGNGNVTGSFYFPKTRYYGSKRRLNPWLHRYFKKLEFQTALDVFGGSGSVSSLLLQMGKDVTFHDCFKFNEVSARATLSKRKISISRDAFIKALGEVKPEEGFVQQTFKGIFYTDEENRWIDGFMGLMSSMQGSASKNLMLHCFFQACLQKRPYNMFHRPNLNLRTNMGVIRSFGNATTWERTFSELMTRAFDELCIARKHLKTSARIIKPMPVLSLPDGFDFVYIDPPYLAKSAKLEPYIRRYHFLEGLSRHSAWPRLIDARSPVKSFADGYLPERWEDKSEANGLLEDLIRRHRKSVVALSYLDGGMPSKNELRAIFDANFGRVKLVSLDFTYALSKKRAKEILIIGEP